MSVTNLRLPNGELSDAVDTMRHIHITQRFRYKVGLSLGLILQHKEDREKLSYYHASQNNARLLQPLPTIADSTTFQEFVDLMENMDTYEEVRKLCDSDTKWQVLFASNLNVCVYMGPREFPIGGRVNSNGPTEEKRWSLRFSLPGTSYASFAVYPSTYTRRARRLPNCCVSSIPQRNPKPFQV